MVKKSVLSTGCKIPQPHIRRMESKRLSGSASAEKPSRAMGCRAVPFGVAFPNTDKTSVPHIDRDEQQLSPLCGYSTFTDHAGVMVNIVVDRLKERIVLQRSAGEIRQDPIRDDTPVPRRIVLTDPRIVQVGLTVLTGQMLFPAIPGCKIVFNREWGSTSANRKTSSPLFRDEVFQICIAEIILDSSIWSSEYYWASQRIKRRKAIRHWQYSRRGKY